MLDWTYYALLVLILFTGLLLNLFTLPGNWLMLISVGGFGWLTHWRHTHWAWVAAMAAIAVVAELVEFLAAGRGAKQAGGTIWGTVGALVGALVGAIFLTGLIPIPILGTLVGILVGTFAGAAAAEALSGQHVVRSAWIGVGAAKGRLYGTILKFGSGCLIFLLALIAAFPAGRARATPAVIPARSPPTTAPTTAATNPA